MHDGVQFANAIGKCGVGQALAIDGAVAIQDLAAKAFDHGVIVGSPGSVEPVGQRVCLQEVRAACDQHLAHRGLAAGHAASEAYT